MNNQSMTVDHFSTMNRIKVFIKGLTLFKIALGCIFFLICFITLIPLWKVFVDSLDLRTAYGMKIWPEVFGFDGYVAVFTNPTLYKPLLVSLLTTVIGTLTALTLTTLGAYVLIQYEMPGRRLMSAMLLFTMMFTGGMIPTYLVLRSLGMTNTLYAVILLPALNVFNLVLMRNFFEGIPGSLFEAASIDGCSPMGTFFKIVLPLSKAAIAAIGLMFVVQYWNDYTNYKIYIIDSELFNFQMKLRSIITGSDTPEATGMATENTVKSAATIVAIMPFMILYPFAQQYFIKGINIGAVKE